ncbi:MAG TPA: hypothetical protein VGO68_07555 [Pyrinomonadaceae bacterium]|jgi:hypothetical protein|nr:hypothetical protein [Pyrinomonadaceae bacterium]
MQRQIQRDRKSIDDRSYLPEKLWRQINPFVPPGTLTAKEDTPDERIKKSLDEAEELLGKDPCAKFVTSLGLDPAGIMPKLRGATLNEHHDQMSSLGDWVHAVQNGNAIDFYKPFFLETRAPNLDARKVQMAPAPLITRRREPKEQGQDTLHEGIHLFSGKDDIQMANLLLKPGQQPFTDREKASEFWNDKLKKNCQ